MDPCLVSSLLFATSMSNAPSAALAHSPPTSLPSSTYPCPRPPGPPGALPSPAGVMCYAGQDVAGTELSRSTTAASTADCAQLCISAPGCAFSTFWAWGTDGAGPSTCVLKAQAFAGTQPPATTAANPLVTSLCFRAVPAPQVPGETPRRPPSCPPGTETQQHLDDY